MEKMILPLGIQDFREMRENGYYYVDKTEYIHRMTWTRRKHFCLSRPRKFGKSLFVSTLKEAFKGNEELFHGLALHDKWDWNVRHPVIHLDFSNEVCSSVEDFDCMVDSQLCSIERHTGLSTKSRMHSGRLVELVEGLHSQTGQTVVLLVDGYDKPILDTIEDAKTATIIGGELYGMYATTKYSEYKIRFSYFTGTASIVSIVKFCEMPNIEDISMQERHSAICGYADSDIDEIFTPELEGLDREKIHECCSEGRWLGEESVYNPFCILRLFDER